MIIDTFAEHIHMAEAAQAWLRQRGSRVTDVRFFMRRPLLEIVCPPVELVLRATRIVERSAEGDRSVWIASLNHCQILWR